MANQLSASELQELKKLYQDIDGLTQSQADAMANQVQQIGNARRELDRLKTEYNKLTSDISDSLTIYQRITQEISNQSIGINESKKGYRGLTSIAEKLQYHQQEISNLSSKDVKKLIEKTNQEVQRLKNSQTLLNDKKSELEAEKRLAENTSQRTQAEINRLTAKASLDQAEYRRLGRLLSLQDKQNKNIDNLSNKLQDVNNAYASNKAIIEGEDEATKNLNRTLEKTLKDTIAIEKSMGVTGALMKGVSKIPFLGDLPGMADLTKEIEEDIKRINKEREAEGKEPISRAKALSMTFKKMGPVIKDSLTDPLVVGGFFLKKMIEGFSELDKAQTEFTRETGKNVDHIDTLNMGLTTSSQYIKQATALTKQFGINATAIFTPETLQEVTEMVELMGVGADEAGRLARFSKLNGKELNLVNENIVKQINNFNKVNKTGINQKQVLEAVAKTSDHIAMTFGGNAEKIAASVSEAKKLGLSLEQVDKIAESLLNFEDSISAELEAELLSGKEINLEKARLLALNNDLNGLTKEIGNNQEVINTFTTGNRIQQDAIAKSMGLSREEMAQMIFDQRMINGLSDEQLEKVTGMTAEDMKRLSVQESINNSIAKMSEALAGPLEMFASLIDNAGILYTIMGLIGTVMTVTIAKAIGQSVIALAGMIPKTATLLGLEVGVAAARIASASALTLGLGALGIIAGIAATMAVVNSFTKPKTPGLAEGGTIVGEGSVMVGENGPEILSAKPGATVTPLSKINAASESRASMAIDYDKLAAAMSKIQINNTLTVDKQVLASTVNSTNNTTSVQIQ